MITPPTLDLAISQRDGVFAPGEFTISLEARQRAFRRLWPGLKLEDALAKSRRARDRGVYEQLLGSLYDAIRLGRRALEFAQKPFAMGVEHAIMRQNQAPTEQHDFHGGLCQQIGVSAILAQLQVG